MLWSYPVTSLICNELVSPLVMWHIYQIRGCATYNKIKVENRMEFMCTVWNCKSTNVVKRADDRGADKKCTVTAMTFQTSWEEVPRLIQINVLIRQSTRFCRYLVVHSWYALSFPELKLGCGDTSTYESCSYINESSRIDRILRQSRCIPEPSKLFSWGLWAF